MPTLLVITASTRPGRVGPAVADWFIGRVAAHGGFEAQHADLAQLDLPMLDEPAHPRLHRYTKDHTRAWSATVDAADAVVMVTAEYNYGYPAPLKSAIDYLNHEWRHKPVGFVSYGGVAAGTRAVQQLKQVVGALSLVAVTPSVNIPFITQFLDDDGAVVANDVMAAAAADMLDELIRVQAALAPLRSGS
ncbi:MAG: NAD(P)H-dependent oxidoreductase [Solirubrobacteraceae bacterium]